MSTNANQKDHQSGKEIYPFQRNDEERERLNRQHDMINRLTQNTPVDPQITPSKLLRIADVATGTGIWLQDIATTLSQHPTTDPTSPRQYTGFDISPVHFPAPIPPNTEFHIHNILHPFPPAFHSQFELVHIRLLVLALREDQFATAVRNALQLVKPGGWIQWEEFESAKRTWHPPSEIATLVQDIFGKSAARNGLSDTPCADISQHLVDLGCEDVRVVDYDSAGGEEFAEEVKEWVKGGAKAGLFPALLTDGEGRSENEARSLADEVYERWVRALDDGAVLNIPFVRVVGKKAGGAD